VGASIPRHPSWVAVEAGVGRNVLPFAREACAGPLGSHSEEPPEIAANLHERVPSRDQLGIACQ